MAEDIKQEKLSYEQLETAAKQLYEQNQMLVNEMRKTVLNETVARLDFSFKTLDHKEFFSQEVIDRITGEIVKMLLPPEEDEKTCECNGECKCNETEENK